MKPISELQKVKNIDLILKKNGWNHSLFAKLIEKAENNQGFSAQFSEWLKNGSTILLRKMTNYWNLDLINQDFIDGIDSAFALEA